MNLTALALIASLPEQNGADIAACATGQQDQGSPRVNGAIFGRSPNLRETILRVLPPSSIDAYYSLTTAFDKLMPANTICEFQFGGQP